MSEKDDQNPGGEGGDEGTVIPKSPVVTPPEASSDPLDAIVDEKARNEAKAHRAIARRAAKKQESADDDDAEDDEPVSSVYATKDDLKKLATNDAKKLVPEHVREAWDELVAIPLGGFDAMDAESIAQNMQKRFNLYLIDNPDKAPDPANDFTTTPHMPVGTGGGAGKPKAPVAKPLPNFKEPAQPDSWYPKEG